MCAFVTNAGVDVVKTGLVQKSIRGGSGALVCVEGVLDDPDGGVEAAAKLRAVHGECVDSAGEEGHGEGGRRYGRSVEEL